MPEETRGEGFVMKDPAAPGALSFIDLSISLMSPRLVWSRSSFIALATISPTRSPSGTPCSSVTSRAASSCAGESSARETRRGASVVSCDCSRLSSS